MGSTRCLLLALASDQRVDPAARPTFKGTRIFVADVLADVARGLSWEFIDARWGGGQLGKAAIAEAEHLARITFMRDDRRPALQGELSLAVFIAGGQRVLHEHCRCRPGRARDRRGSMVWDQAHFQCCADPAETGTSFAARD